jgi:asparagine synthase (glutamine-hydrolysing)
LAAAAPYRKLARWRRRGRYQQHRWFTPHLAEQLLEAEDGDRAVSLNAVLANSVYRTPLPRILRIEDRNSMAHSIESRLPFLDYRLVSLVFGLPADWHMRGPWNKFVLREAMQGKIPESVRSRGDKMGFPVSAREWLAGVLHEPVLDLLHSRKLRERGIYHVDNIMNDLKRHRTGGVDVSEQIFDLAQFEVWSDL